MRTWIYTYQDSEGHKHEAEIGAPSKDDAYAELRGQGIRPIRVIERIVPIERRGFRGLRKRDWAVVAVVAAFVVAGVAGGILFRSTPANAVQPDAPRKTSRGVIESEPVALELGDRVAKPRPRKQITGGGAHGATERAAIFKYESERWLACFAEPGAAVDLRNAGNLAADLIDALDEDIVIRAADGPAVVDLKRVVAGLKDEVAELLAAGNSIEEIAERFVQRQKMESDYRATVVENARRTGDAASANKSLVALGMAPVE